MNLAVASREIRDAWYNNVIPAIIVPPRGDLWVRLPYNQGNKDWLRLSNHRPSWNQDQRRWETPRAWLTRLTRKAVSTHGQCYVIQSYRKAEKCAPACQEATGVDCGCSCLGEHHGQGSDDSWFSVNETFACRWSGVDYAIRLLGKHARRPSDADMQAASGPKVQTYFVRAGDKVKIGRSTDVEGRMRSLQTANPHRLELLCVIDGDEEANWHRYFADRHVGGEWFEISNDDLFTED